MNPLKKLGICMDHSSAHIIDFASNDTEKQVIDSKFTHEEKANAISKSEHLMHNKEQHQQAEFYKKLADVILKYDDVLLFGPTEAKTELYNTIKDNHLFEKINIKTKNTDKQTENQQNAFVRDYFSNRNDIII